MEWFEEHEVNLLDFPPRSPDLNPIENLWGLLARKVYSEGRHFQSKGDLISYIKQEWENLDQEILKNLIQSMPNRIYEVILKKGSYTKY